MIPAPHYTQIPNIVLDEISKTLKEGELRVIFVILRQTFGWHKAWDRISLSQLMQKTGMERKSVSNSLKSLIDKGLITKHKEGRLGEQNCWYRLVTEPVQPDDDIPDNEPVQKSQKLRVKKKNPIDDSNNSDQYPKDTPPSILRIPTKETPTKETKNPPLSPPKANPSDSASKEEEEELQKRFKERPKKNGPVKNLKAWNKKVLEDIRSDRQRSEMALKTSEKHQKEAIARDGTEDSRGCRITACREAVEFTLGSHYQSVRYDLDEDTWRSEVRWDP